MDPKQEKDIDNLPVELAEDDAADESVSVDDFIRELEKKEKDLHITSETTFIELASDFDDEEIPDFLKEDIESTQRGSVDSDSKALKAEVKRMESEIKRLEKETATLQAKVGGLQEERTELYKNAQRRLKDFEAFKARTERERSETFQRQLSNLATQMLPALDNLDRAFQFASDLPDDERNGFAQFFDGIVLVNQQVNEVLGGMGIVPIASVGETFDPHYHEAVAIDELSDLPPNIVTTELLRGFRIGEHVIRHSMVKVSMPAPAPTEDQTTEPSPEDSPGESQDANLDAESDNSRLEEPETGENESAEANDADTSTSLSASEPEPGAVETKGFEIECNGEVVGDQNEKGDETR